MDINSKNTPLFYIETMMGGGHLNQPTTFAYSTSIALNISSGTVVVNFLRRLAFTRWREAVA